MGRKAKRLENPSFLKLEYDNIPPSAGKARKNLTTEVAEHTEVEKKNIGIVEQWNTG
jgi:hypothetical protein